MDYELLSSFRNALQKFVSSSKAEEKTTSTITANSQTLGAHTVIHELRHFPSVVDRLRLARFVPKDHRLPILKGEILQPPTKGTESRPLLAAQFSSLQASWSDTQAISPEVTRMLGHLAAQYAKISSVAPRAAAVPKDMVSLLQSANTRLRAMDELRAVMHDDGGLDAVEENLQAEWAALRALAPRLEATLVKARRLRLDADVAAGRAVYARCERTRQFVVNRDVDLPNLHVQLGAGAMRRVPMYDVMSGAIQADDIDDDSDDWDEPVTLAQSSAPVSPLRTQRDRLSLQLTGQVTATPSESQQNTSVSLDLSGVVAGGSSKDFNKSLLDAFNRNRHDAPSQPSGKQKKKASTARERLSAKLGIKKRRKRSDT